MNFHQYFPHLLSTLVKSGIKDLHIMLLKICKFYEIGLLIGVNKTVFICLL